MGGCPPGATSACCATAAMVSWQEHQGRREPQAPSFDMSQCLALAAAGLGKRGVQLLFN